MTQFYGDDWRSMLDNPRVGTPVGSVACSLTSAEAMLDRLREFEDETSADFDGLGSEQLFPIVPPGGIAAATGGNSAAALERLAEEDASTQQEVDVAAAEALGLTQSQVSIYLSGKGFLKLRRMRGLQNEYFYQYSFTIDGEKTKAQFMRLPRAAKEG